MSALTKFRIASLVALIFFGAWLIFGPDPVEAGIAAAEAAGKKVKVEHYIASGLWQGALIGGGIALLALVASPWLCRPAQPINDSKPSLPRSQKRFTIAVGVLTIAITAATNYQRLSQSLWDDEAKAMRMFIVGKLYQHSKTNEWKFKEATWSDTFFNYRLPNNHILFSAAAKLSHSGHNVKPTEPDAMYFSEWRLRLPSFLAGLGSIALVGALLTTLGFQRAAVFAMPLTALHPWFLRYLVEARGYAMVIFFTLLATLFLVRALQCGRWRWWLAFSAATFCLLWTYPVALYTAVTLFGTGALVLWFSPRFRGTRLAMTGRLVSAGLLMSAFIIFVMSPTLPQLQNYLAEDRDLQTLNPRLTADSISLFFTGTHWRLWDSGNPLSVALKDDINDSLAAFLVVAIPVALALLAGIVRLALKRTHAWLLLPVFLIPPAAFLAQAAVQQTAFYPWYIIGTIPIVPMLIALGADYAARPLGNRRAGGLVAIGSALLVIWAFSSLTSAQRNVTRNHPIEPTRDAFELYRSEVTNPFHPDIDQVITIGFHQENNTYDPKLHRLDDPQQQHRIHDLIAEARETGKPLYVDFGQEAYARLHFDEIFSLLDDPQTFELVAELPGLELQNTRKVMRLLPTQRHAPPAAP
ncbi:glycosyltransferase family 39 protein [Sulfuriroseicoccus oceanibius]|uniref:Glycosyltransferase family 39 protein n=1 Tax=Sulfuriroseicoccus oceanibius TaxID=2707525 RepID=A0A6B3L7I7_9BACT|nr:glycosyltransferase family 39 protein [Sulfuriroseicoccus oceanibius]QQL44407.1 glycosyltransferase family 39 protein [Sulfuriroseicoccus oceanibius]